MKKKYKILQTGQTAPNVHAGESKRKWMDDTNQSFAYRCLPLNIANMHGWEVRCHAPFRCYWTGGNAEQDLVIQSDAPKHLLPTNIFGHGILTFHVHALIESEPGWNTLAMGPLNHPKDGITPLAGVIETDWSPYTFTMNWKVTRPHMWISFAEGEPYCFLMPVKRNYLSEFEPTLECIDPDSEKGIQHYEWAKSRNNFNKDLKVQGSQAQQDKWQKNYYTGKMPDGSDVEMDPAHNIKIRVPEPRDLRTEEQIYNVHSIQMSRVHGHPPLPPYKPTKKGKK
jgi:hypothetical protein